MTNKLIAGVVLACGTAWGSAMDSTVGRVAQPPTVDGKADACYAAAYPITGFTYPGRMDLAPNRTTIRFVHDGTRLYGFVTCCQDMSKVPVSTPVRQDPDIWRSSSLEIFFVTEDGMRYFALGPSGSVGWTTAHPDDANHWVHAKNPASDVQAAATRDGTAWQVEFSIPLAELPGTEWRFLAVRNVPGAGSSYSLQQDANGLWNEKTEYGRLVRIDRAPGLPGFDALPPFDASKPFEFALTNASGTVEYRYGYEIPVPYIKLTPANLQADEPVLLNGDRGLETMLSWSCRHNYTNICQREGRATKVPFTIRFTVPKGILVQRAERTGEAVLNGVACDVYEQKCPRAYNASHWVRSFFTSTLKGGTTGEISYALAYADGAQAARTIPFRVIDVPATKAPKRFVTGHYNLWVRNVQEADRHAKSGVNTFAVRGFGKSTEELCRGLLARGYRVRRGDYFWPGAVNSRTYEDWTRLDESARALDINRKPIPSAHGFQISPAYRGRFYREAIEKEAEFNRKTGANWWAFDLEGYIQRKGEQADFRPEVIARFQENWAKGHPAEPMPDPFVFEREPEKHPEEHRYFVDAKCELWGEFFAEMKRRVSELSGFPVRFTEWSMNTIEDLERRSHSLRGAKFFQTMDLIELDTYAGVDRDMRQLKYKIDAYHREFPGVRLDIMLTPYPGRLGRDPNGHYFTTAPKIPDENVCVFKEAMTMGAKGIYTWYYPAIDMEYLRQFAIGVNLVNKVEDIVMDGTSFYLTSDFPSDAAVKDKFFGKMSTWTHQPRVFTRAISLGDRTLISVSEYRELKDITVRVNYAPRTKVRMIDLDTDRVLGTFGPDDKVIPVSLDAACRCRLVLLEPVKD